MPSFKSLFAAGLVASLATVANAHSALLANGKLLGKLNSGECFNCAVGQYPVPKSIPSSAVDASDPADGIGAWIKSSGTTVKETWNLFHGGTSYGSITEPEAIKSATCGRYDPTAVGDVPSGAKISYKKSNHNGPAEIWVDGTKTWFGNNFIEDGKSITADAFKCNKASCQVTWYWLGKVKVKDQWNYYQLYVQCFVVKGSGSGGSASAPAPASGSSDSTPGTVAPANGASSGNTSGNTSGNSADDKAARKAEKEKKKAEKAAAKEAKEKNQNLRF